MQKTSSTPKKTIIIENHWIIKSAKKGKRPFFYYGTFGTRKEAITRHSYNLGISWKKCYRRGDRAVRVVIVDDLIGWYESVRTVTR